MLWGIKRQKPAKAKLKKEIKISLVLFLQYGKIALETMWNFI